jgi:hypothetical protein
VAGGTQPNAELRTHLQSCADCNAFFERQRHLFAAIDAGLQAFANSALPSSFFPVLRVRMNEQVAPFRKSVSLRRVVLVTAAAAVIVLSLVRLHHRAPGQSPEVMPGPPQPSAEASLPRTPLEQPKFGARPQPPHGIAPPENNSHAENRRQLPPLKHSAAEIIVPADQEILLARYAEQLSQRRKVPARMPDDALSAATRPLEVDLIQIAQLDVKPLADRPE